MGKRVQGSIEDGNLLVGDTIRKPRLTVKTQWQRARVQAAPRTGEAYYYAASVVLVRVDLNGR